MFKFLILFSIFIQSSFSERSFTVVLDTTNSMKDEILAIKANIGPVVNASSQSNFGNFVMVTFKDLDVDAPFTTTSPAEFMARLNSLQTHSFQGDDCRENSLAGIEAALRASEKQSTIFVFTDAYAKDYNNFHAVETLCKDTHSQVMIFLSGYCGTSENHQQSNAEIYYNVAKACSGAVLKFDTSYDLRKVFKYMKEITNTDWTNVTPHEKFENNKQISFSVDSFVTDIMIVVSATDPLVEVVADNTDIKGVETLFNTRHCLVIRIRQPNAGEYTAHIRGQGSTFVTFYEKNYVPFEFGFSTKSPRSIRETGARPLAGWTNFILINVDSSIKLRSIEWLNFGDTVKQILLLKQNPSGSYVSSVFVEQGKMFRFWIIGEEIATHHEIKGSSKILAPQSNKILVILYWDLSISKKRQMCEREGCLTYCWLLNDVPLIANTNGVSKTKPEVEILDSELGLIDFGSPLTLACKVIAYPTPEIRWQDETNEILASETIVLEIPSVYMSYMTISNVTKNLTLTCNAGNEVAVVYKGIDIYVNRTFSFDVIQSPEDASVEYGTEHSLHCQVDAYPEATIKWYLNNTLVDTYTNKRVLFEDNALVIKNMEFEDIGAYECRASNDVESKTFTAKIEITGVEAPEIEKAETEIILKPEAEAKIECKLSKGKPTPEIVWKFKNVDDTGFKTLPDGVSAVEGKLAIAPVQKIHEGVYACVASNILGEDTKEINVKIQYPPVIKGIERETMVVKEGDQVRLSCDVEATPEATVRWEMSQDDVIVSLDHRHKTDKQHTHYFRALWNDAGNYHCVAENEVGKAERTINLDVLVLPYIETPKSKYKYVRVGDSVTLPCNVIYGNPAPTIRWEFTPKDSYSRVLNRNDSSSALHLIQVSHNDQGSYLCITENQIGIDRIKYHLIVQQ